MKYKYNNCWWLEYPTINFFTFESFYCKVLGYNCIIEHYQDGEIWSDDEYWGSILYDLDNDRYANFCTYIDEKEAEKILAIWKKKIPAVFDEDEWDGKISEDFGDDKDKIKSINFYKDYITSGTNLSFEDYYKQIYKND